MSLSVYDFDRSVTSLSPDLFTAGVRIRHLQFSHSHLQILKDNSLKNLRETLESLSIVNGKLTQVKCVFYVIYVLHGRLRGGSRLLCLWVHTVYSYAYTYGGDIC